MSAIPTDAIFGYDPRIDKQIGPAVAGVLHTEVFHVVRIEKGVVNHVYRIETALGPVIARVFSRKGWPEEQKLQWIEQTLTAHGIPHAKLKYLSREASYFPYGFMVVEYIEGQDGWEAMKVGVIGVDAFFEQLGALLRRVHGISIAQFGQVQAGKGTHRELCAYLQELIEEDIAQMRTIPEFPAALTETMQHAFQDICNRHMHQMAPVLTHGDPTPHNTRLTPAGQIVLIDWDNAEASSFLRDVAALTYGDALAGAADAADLLKSQWKPAFWKGYGSVDIPKETRAEIIRMFQVVQAARLLTFYHFRRADLKQFRNTLARLERLLS